MTKKERAEYKMKRLKRLAEAQRIVASKTCPQCGAPLYRNLSLPGWWQCEGYPAASHRHAGFERLPKCDFQTFYDPTPEEHTALLGFRKYREQIQQMSMSELEGEQRRLERSMKGGAHWQNVGEAQEVRGLLRELMRELKRRGWKP